MVAIALACPDCMAPIARTDETYQCRGCGREFPVLLGIPDLRIQTAARLDYEHDRLLAMRLATMFAAASSSNLVEQYWRARGETDPDRLQARVDYVSRSESKYRNQLSQASWIRALMTKPGQWSCLELGCGPGGFLLAAAEHFDLVVGIDISLAWLVIAKKRLEEKDRTGLLFCACAEALPLSNEQFDFVGLFDVIEHVTDRSRTLQEVVRVTRTGGQLVCTTPNRFSLSAEPHVGVWGVGFLPRAWMPGYVRWRTGQEYRDTHLLSIFELRALFKRYSALVCTFQVPRIWEGELQAFPPLKRAFARGYNAILLMKGVRPALQLVAPFFMIIGRKNSRSVPGAGHRDQIE